MHKYINDYTSHCIEKEIIKLCTKNSVTHFCKSYIIHNLKDISKKQIEHCLETSNMLRKSMIKRIDDVYIFNNFSSILYDMWIFFKDDCFRKYGNKKY
jgi:hypothetical protein